MILRKKCVKGFTLIEVIIVILILGILAAIAIPSYTKYISKAKENVCKVNCLQIERTYEVYLESEDGEHSDEIFNKFLIEYGESICPCHGNIICVGGEVKCDYHSDIEYKEDNDDGVPYI